MLITVFRPQFFLGLFSLLTLLLAGAAVGQHLGLSASESAYLMLFITALIGWVVSRRMFRRGQ